MRGIALSALMLALLLSPGCDNRGENSPETAQAPAAQAGVGQGGMSLQPLSVGPGAPTGGVASTGDPAMYAPAPAVGNIYQPDPFVAGGQPYAVQSGQPAVMDSGRPRRPSPYDALFEGPYGNRGYITQPSVPTTPIVTPQPVVTYPAPVVTTYSAPVTTTYSAPVVTTYPAPVTTTYAAPVVTTYSAPATTTYSAPVATTYPAPATTTYSSPPVVTYSSPTVDPLTTTTFTETVITPIHSTSYSVGRPVETVTAREVAGIQLVPAPDVQPGIHPGDAAPSQWFEIIRPGNGPIRIGRVSATCVCVGVRVPKRQIAAGERALIEARTVSKPPRNNLTYGIFVNVMEPQNVMLDTDVTIRY